MKQNISVNLPNNPREDEIEYPAFARRLWTTTIVAAVALIGIGFWIKNSPGFVTAEDHFLDFLTSVTGWMKPINLIVAYGVAGAAIILIAIVCTFIIWKRFNSVWVAFYDAVIAMGPLVYVFIVKYIVHRTRSNYGGIHTPDDPSFPSGHTAGAITIMIFILLIAAGTKYYKTAKIVAIIFPLFVGFTRLSLGVHYPSDVIASLIICPLIAASLWVFVGPRLPRVQRPQSEK